MLKYKGYTANIEYSSEDKVFLGKLANIKDVILFEGHNPEEIERAFKEAVEDYLESCRKLGDLPEKPYSGKIALRIKPELHSELVKKASMRGLTLTAFITEQLAKCS